jgi:hypothetical protein
VLAPFPLRPVGRPHTVAGRGLAAAVLLARVLVAALVAALVAVPVPRPAGAQAPPAPVACVRRHVPDPGTLAQIIFRYPRDVASLSGPDFRSVMQGPDFPGAAQDPTGFAQALQAIFGAPPAPCTQLGLKTGDVIEAPGGSDIAVVAAAPSRTPAPAPPGGPATPARASDGQRLGLQPAGVQAAFQLHHGDAAEARWIAEHEAELTRAAP